MIEVREIFAPDKYFIELGGFSNKGWSTFKKRWQLNTNEKGWSSVFQVIDVLRTMNTKISKDDKVAILKHKYNIVDDEGNEKDAEIHVMSVKEALDYEKLQEVRIKNQERLGRLIPVQTAKDRVRTAFQAVANKIRYAAKAASVRVAISANARDCENIILEAWNGAVDLLGEEAKNVAWEKEGASVKLGGTVLAEAADEGASSDSSEQDSDTTEE